MLTGYENKTVAALTDAVTGLTAGQTYYYRVRAVNTGGTSGNSNTITVVMLPATPGAPVATAGTSVTQTSFAANWETVAGADDYRLDVSSDDLFTSYVDGV